MSFEAWDNPEPNDDSESIGAGEADDAEWQENISDPAITAPEDDNTASEPQATLPNKSWTGFEIVPALSPLERSDDEPDKPFLSFRQPFDGSQPEISSEEQIEAGTAFAEFVDEEVAEGLSKGGVKADDNGDLLLVKVSNKHSDTRPEDPAEKHVRVEGLEWAPGGPRLTGYAADYRLDIDGAVRRHDSRPPTLEEYARDQERRAAMREISMGIDPDTVTREEIAQRGSKLNDLVGEVLAERLIALELGEQNQPVSREEVEKLVRLARGR